MHHTTAARVRRRRWLAVVAVVGSATTVASMASRPERSTAVADSGRVGAVEIDARLPTPAAPAVVVSDPPVPETAPPSTSVPARHARLLFVGDVLMHSPLVERAARDAGGVGFDFRPMFAELRPTIAGADLAVCHLETPVAPLGQALSTAPLYGVPGEVTDALAWAGFDHCSTASNHALDRGVAGVDATIGALERAGISQTGMARSAGEAEPIVLEVEGIRIAPLSYTYGFNGIPLPDGEPWRSNLIDVWRILSDALVARERGAEVVVVSLHWGTETRVEPNDDQLALADTLMASGLVDLVVGHHAHVVQPIADLHGRWVVYGMGNIISNLPTSDMWPASSQDAMLVEVDVTVSGDDVEIASPVVRPTWVDKRNGWVVRDVLRDLADPMLAPERRTVLEASLWRTGAVVGEYLPG
jgi:poly-gamma-glutamate capsule biosynthesis protein CapA/YwtB (metallophosphatase superfamily)